MELYQLAYFVEVAVHRNFTRAARHLRLAQPALSQQIRNLERELGAVLFVRGPRETVLTSAGQAFLPKVHELLAAAASAKQLVADIAQLKQGRLTIAAIPSLSGYWLPEFIRRFRKSHPKVELVLREGRSDQVCAMVDSAEAELGFLQFPVDKGKFDHGRILDERFVLLVPRNHPLANENAITFPRLASESFVLYKGKAREVVIEACRQAGFEPRVSCESEELETVRSLVAADLGIAVLPELGVKRPVKNAVVRNFSRQSPKRTLGWISKKGQPLSSAAAALQEGLSKVI